MITGQCSKYPYQTHGNRAAADIDSQNGVDHLFCLRHWNAIHDANLIRLLLMLVVLLLFALFRALQGIPLSSPINPPDDFSPFYVRDGESHFGKRTVNDIIISCFATIFACTWSAIHPNIPAVMDSWWTRFKRQVMTMICALIAPKLITFWAFHQRLVAKGIMEEYNREVLGDLTEIQSTSMLDSLKGFFRESPPPASSDTSVNKPRWTLTHGFFLQMGGFMLSDDGRPVTTGIIRPPRIMEDDIQDKSKGDIISKTLIILQTTWFIVQCIARWSQYLPVTELEIVTLGFAMLNGITYALWWNKPQSVGRPVFIERERLVCECGETIDTVKPMMEDYYPSEQEGFLMRKLHKSREHYPARVSAIDIFRYFLQWVVRPLKKLFYDDIVYADRVSVFYRPLIQNELAIAAVFIPVIGTFFGAVHPIPSWFLDFASRQEKWLWRTCAMIMVTTPIIFGLAARTKTSTIVNFFRPVIVVATVFSCCSYPFARIILLILSLTSLHTLSPAAHQTIEWTTFIPHFVGIQLFCAVEFRTVNIYVQ
ncbi:hypothetical protein BDN70DRAFT_997348 [Pholiota conissans]|uniref:Uncharacterized protein n=1 Tax=Pholiota conissans TaxID=109636 RepID=A0A9P5YSU3_9AGAR|nr:hypothetical protein BDN70DRAFT_997348 [Pholiota conissans]